MSTGSLNLDILLEEIREDAISNRAVSISSLKRQFPSLSEKELSQLHSMFMSSFNDHQYDGVELVITAPASFAMKAKPTMTTMRSMIEHANSSILITGYSLSDYFADLVECMIRKSQTGVLVKFYVNNVESQKCFDRLLAYKSRYLRIYNYPPSEDKMSALHAKVVSVDKERTLITSANLSYHGQEGNIELGTLIESKNIAQQVDELFTQLLFKKVFVEV